MNIIEYLNRPSQLSSRPWLNVIVASLLVCFILAVFRPFGLYQFGSPIIYRIVLSYTLATAVSAFIVAYILPFLFKGFYNSQKWTIGKKLINQITLITLIVLGNYIVSRIMGFSRMTTLGSLVLSYLLITLTIGIIPAIVIAFIEQNYSLRHNLEDAKKLNQLLIKRLDRKDIPDVNQKKITLSGTTKDLIALLPHDIVYIESIGNYVKINYIKNNTIEQKQIRFTLSAVEKEIAKFSDLVRCHRAYIVNISYITHVEGNSAGLQLQLENIKERIPVSRSYVKIISEKIK